MSRTYSTRSPSGRVRFDVATTQPGSFEPVSLNPSLKRPGRCLSTCPRMSRVKNRHTPMPSGRFTITTSFQFRSRPEPHSADVECTLHLLEDATKPLVLAGGGCVRSGSGDALKTFVENTGIPVVTSNSGRGILDETSSWSLGVVGRRGSDGANEALGQADLVLGIGARFSGLTTSNWTRPDPETTLVQVDIDSAELASQYPVECPVTADARAFLESITDRAGNIDLSWEEVISEYRDRVRTERAAFSPTRQTQNRSAHSVSLRRYSRRKTTTQSLRKVAVSTQVSTPVNLRPIPTPICTQSASAEWDTDFRLRWEQNSVPRSPGYLRRG